MSEPLQISVHVEEKRYQPTQEKTVVPDWDAKAVTPDKGYALSKVTVEGMPEPTESETFTENGTYDVGRIGTAIVDVGIDLQNKTVTPTEQTQTIQADTGYDGLDTVTVNPIPTEYVVPTGSVDITANGQVIVSGKAEVNVNVPQGVFPSGTKLITENVTGEDVKNYAAVDVAVPGPTGTKQINITANGTTTEDVSEYADAEITVNTDPEKGVVYGDYDADGWPHSARFVGVWTEIPSRMFWNFARADGTASSYGKKITSFPIPQTVVSIGEGCFYDCMSIVDIGTLEYVNSISYNAFDSCSHLGPSIRLKDGVLLGNGTNYGGCFSGCRALKTVTFLGDVAKIPALCFDNCPNIELYDFSNCTEIPALFGTYSVSHKSGCVFRIPAALSDTTLGAGNGWESATNWSALTNIVWEVV